MKIDSDSKILSSFENNVRVVPLTYPHYFITDTQEMYDKSKPPTGCYPTVME